MIDRRLAELAPEAATAPNVGVPSPRKVDRLQTLLLSIFPEPEESRRIESLFAHDSGFSGETVCHYIREACSR
jgi:hypothetical protein